MRVGELKAQLADYDDDLPIKFNTVGGEEKLSLRDIVCGYGREPTDAYSVLCIGSTYSIGYDHLTPDVEEKMRREILRKLDGNYHFMKNGGEYVLYSGSGSQAHCYGTCYDPRIWLGLERDGLIKRGQFGSGFNSEFWTVTPKGKDLLEAAPCPCI